MSFALDKTCIMCDYPGKGAIMQSPVTYQGGKGRLAEEIVSQMLVPTDAMFYDFCCGSGTVSLALYETGHSPEHIVMVDSGPWGVFWDMVGA